MKIKLLCFLRIFCILFAFSKFEFASSFEFTCKLDPAVLKDDPFHVYRDKIIPVMIDDAFRRGTLNKFDHSDRKPTKLWCNGSQSALECFGVVVDYNYPRGTRIEVEFFQEGDSYKLRSLYYDTYPESVIPDVFLCEKK